jgi:hypothetical protein
MQKHVTQCKDLGLLFLEQWADIGGSGEKKRHCASHIQHSLG